MTSLEIWAVPSPICRPAELAAQLRLDPPVALAGLVARQQLVLRNHAGPVAVLTLGAGELEIHGRPR